MVDGGGVSDIGLPDHGNTGGIGLNNDGWCWQYCSHDGDSGGGDGGDAGGCDTGSW